MATVVLVDSQLTSLLEALVGVTIAVSSNCSPNCMSTVSKLMLISVGATASPTIISKFLQHVAVK